MVAGRQLPSDAELLASLPQKLDTVGELKTLLTGLHVLKLCIGNDDERYFDIQAVRKGIFRDSTGHYII